MQLALRTDLHDGKSLWQDDANRGKGLADLLSRNVDCEIAVIGAGISGAIATLMLAAAGHDVVVLDRRLPGQGSTLASTAMIQFEIDTPLVQLARKIGQRDANRVFRRSFDAVEKLQAIVESHGLDADWCPRPSLYLSGNAFGRRALAEEAAARRRLGLPSEYLTAADLAAMFNIERTAAIRSDGAAEINPVAFCLEALSRARSLGTRIYAPSDVTTIEPCDRGLVLRTRDGCNVTCRKVVLATGYEVIGQVPRNAYNLVSSWAIATKPIAERSFWRDRCLIWEASRPYLYLRTTPDNRIIAGGEDQRLKSPARRTAKLDSKARTLLAKVHRLLGRHDLELDYSWAGAFADSPNSLPVLGPLPTEKRAFAILGCGGNGTTFSVIGGEMAASWARGRQDADADLFAPRASQKWRAAK